MNILNIIDKIYENKYFATILLVAVIVLVILFFLVFLVGLKDAKKAKQPKKQVEEEVKDITFDAPKEVEPVKEDVTFEMPVLTKNLEDFKKSFEEEIVKDQEIEVRTTKHVSLEEATKPVKILDIGVIEDTAVIPNIISEDDLPKMNVQPELPIIKKGLEEKALKVETTEKIDNDKLYFEEDDDF